MAIKLNVGIIGYGYASKTFHAPLIITTDGLNLSAISSSDENKVKQDFPHMTVYADPQALINDPSIDLIIIPTPNNTHYSLASQALKKGKHVIVDKPFTLTLEEAEKLTQQANDAGKLLSVFHNRRWDSGFLTVKKLLADKTLGISVPMKRILIVFVQRYVNVGEKMQELVAGFGTISPLMFLTKRFVYLVNLKRLRLILHNYALMQKMPITFMHY